MKLITKSDTSRRRIAAVGMYDGVHLGHRFLIDYLRLEASSRGLTPSVITFSRHPLSVVRPLEKPGLLSSLEDRVTLLADAGAEDIIILPSTTVCATRAPRISFRCSTAPMASTLSCLVSTIVSAMTVRALSTTIAVSAPRWGSM